MNQSQLKGNQICSGKPRSLWLWAHRQRWPQRDPTISFPSGIPSWNRLEPRYLRTTANCSGVQLFLRWPGGFEYYNLNQHTPFKSPVMLKGISGHSFPRLLPASSSLRGLGTKHYQRSCKGESLAHQLLGRGYWWRSSIKKGKHYPELKMKKGAFTFHDLADQKWGKYLQIEDSPPKPRFQVTWEGETIFVGDQQAKESTKGSFVSLA